MTTGMADAAATDQRVGTVLANRYLIEAVIGRGGMSVVYRAADRFLGRTVALKIFRQDLADAGDLRRQREEFQLLASLNHPTLVTLFDAVADEDGRVFLVLEYIDGHDLRGRLDAATVGEGETAMIGADIAEALAYIHERGIVHRDLKPGNLLVPVRSSSDSGPHAKLADFGIARLIDGTRLTATGSMLGTAGYLSPEQAVGDTVGPPSDIYSLGLVLLECLTGSRAFGGSALESVAARLNRDPDIPVTVGIRWRDILSRMTQREPGSRATAREASTQLRAIASSMAGIESLDGTAPLPESSPTEATPPYTAPPETLESPAASRTKATEEETGTTSPYPARWATAATVPYASQPEPEATEATVPNGPDVATDAAAHRDGSVSQPRSRAGAGQLKRRQRPPRRMLPIGVGVLLVVVLSVSVLLVWKPVDPAAPTVPAYPSVDGTLGNHLDKLQRSVEK